MMDRLSSKCALKKLKEPNFHISTFSHFHINPSDGIPTGPVKKKNPANRLFPFSRGLNMIYFCAGKF